MLSLFENFHNSFDSIASNKLRSSLSMLGIIIWVSSVIILTAIWEGSQQTIIQRVQEMGTNILTIGANRWGGVNTRSVSSSIFDQNMVDEIQTLSGLSGVAPVISSNSQVIYWSQNTQAQVYGINQDYMKVKNIKIAFWTDISQDHLNNLEKVAIIGQTILSDVFLWENPIGKDFKMGKSIFQVIWVIESNSTLDGVVFIPLTTSMIRVNGQKYFSEIIVGVENADTIAQKQAEIETTLKNYLEISSETTTLPYRIRNQAEMLSNLTSITQTLTMLLSGIAAISLLVWGIGVMNIMLVSVTERTKEIGIRKAIWAGKWDILLQFLTESITLSLIGGGIGIAFSFWVVYLLNTFSIAAIITSSSILMSFSFAFAIWVIFWLLPAYKAAKLRPIDALRFE